MSIWDPGIIFSIICIFFKKQNQSIWDFFVVTADIASS